MEQDTTRTRNSASKRRAGHISVGVWVVYILMVLAFVVVTIASMVFR